MDAGAMLFFMIFMVPITAIIVKSPLGEALARRIGGRTVEADQQVLAEMDALRAEVDHLHADLAEVQERLDFSERLLAQRTSSAEREEAR